MSGGIGTRRVEQNQTSQSGRGNRWHTFRKVGLMDGHCYLRTEGQGLEYLSVEGAKTLFHCCLLLIDKARATDKTYI